MFCSTTSFSVRAPFVQAENVFYLYLCIWIAYAECQWLDGLSSPSEFISSIKLSNYLFMSWEEDMYACVWKHAQQCHLALESSEGGKQFLISSSVSAFRLLWSVSRLLWSQHYCVFWFKVLPNFSHLTPGSCFGKYAQFKSLHFGFFNDRADTNNFLSVQNRKTTALYCENSSEIPTRHIICIPCQWCNIIPHCERVSNFSLCESESEQGSYSLPDNCQNNSR